MPKITCCKNCTKRHYACHSNCEEYKRQRTELDEYNAQCVKDREEYSYQMKILRDSSGLPFRSKHYF